MNLLLDEVMAMSADRLLVKNISVTKVYSSRDYLAQGDRCAVMIALTNIIINAIDAMQKEKGLLKLVTHYLAGRYFIQIEDNGCGISDANLKNIFKPYYTSKKDGLGIGLAATKDILFANKVSVHVESELGVGTKFTLSFPRECPVFPVNKVKLQSGLTIS
jgi:signal transduction histidine kinase